MLAFGHPNAGLLELLERHTVDNDVVRSFPRAAFININTILDPSGERMRHLRVDRIYIVPR
ncbi:hypothetical protein D3C86_2030530 [compost metagenome]